MPSYILAVVGYPVSESNGTYEWRIAGARGKQLAAGRSMINGIGNATPQAAERLTYHALLAGLQLLLAEGLEGALTIAAAPAFIALLRPPISPTIRSSNDCASTRASCSTGFVAN